MRPDLKKRKGWMTDEILAMMEERRKLKQIPSEYKRLQNIIRKRIREAKENEKQEQCEEIELLQRKHDHFNIHRKVREVTGKMRRKTWGKLVDDKGKIVLMKEDKKQLWKE